MAPSTMMSAAAMAAFAVPAAAFVPSSNLRASQVALQGTEKLTASQTQTSSASSLSGLTTAGLAAAAVVAGAAGLRPRTSQRRMERKVAGVCLPLTEKFDPLNLGNTDAKMDRYTAVEIKHGRISMIAVLGYIMPEIFRFPGCEDFKHGLGALESIPIEGWAQLVALIGTFELAKPRAGGMGLYDFGCGTELLDGISEEELERKQTVERNNGRLAMVAIIGMMWQDGTFGKTPLALINSEGWWGPGVDFLIKDIGVCDVASPAMCALPQRSSRLTMRATATEETPFVETQVYNPEEFEMSVAVPFLRYPKQLHGWAGEEKGFDPLGVTDALPVYWVREAELKHGRVCMLATLGWIATDIGMRFPGEKFQSIATAVEAHDKAVTAGYMLPFLGAIGTFELYGLWLIFKGWPKEIKRDAGDFFLGKNFLPKDPEQENAMRLKELENGRLAMFAFSGCVTQAVITGKAWPFL